MSSTILILTLQKFDFASTVLFLLHELQLSPVVTITQLYLMLLT